MSTLNPEVQFQVSPGQAVNKPSGAAVAGNLAASFLDMFSAPSAAPTVNRADERAFEEEQMHRDLALSLGEAQDLRHAGRYDEADRLEGRVMTEFAVRGGDPSSARAQTIVTQMTGRPEGFMPGFTETQIAQQRTMETPEFQSQMMATLVSHPDASQEERVNIALSNLALEQETTNVVNRSQREWNALSAPAFQQTVAQFQTSMLGEVAFMEQNGGQLGLEDIQGARQQFNLFKADLLSKRPQNITAEQWAPVKDQLEQVEKGLAYWEDVLSKNNVESKMMLEVMTAIQNAPEMTAFDKNIAALTFAADPSVFLSQGVVTHETVQKVFRAAARSSDEALTVEKLRDPEVWSEPPADDDRAPEEVLEDAQEMIKLGGNMGRTLADNPEMRENWANAVTSGLTGAKRLASEGEWLTADAYQNMFNDSFFDSLAEVKNVDPAMYEAIVAKAQTVLTDTGSSLGSRLQSLTRDTALVFDYTTRSFTLTEESVKELVERDFGTSAIGGVFEAVKDKTPWEIVSEAVDLVYNGDWNALYEDNGRSFDESNPLEKEARAFAGSFEQPGEDAKELIGSINSIIDLQTRLNNVKPAANTPSVNTPATQEAPAAIDTVVDNIIQVESGGRADAKNPNSSATGAGQFIDSTWLNMINKYRPDLKEGRTRQEVLALRNDFEISREMTKAYTTENSDFLESRGHTATAGNLYLAHFLGPAGANKALSASPYATVRDVMGEGVVNANPFLKNYTIANLIAWSQDKMSGRPALGGQTVPGRARATVAPIVRADRSPGTTVSDVSSSRTEGPAGGPAPTTTVQGTQTPSQEVSEGRNNEPEGTTTQVTSSKFTTVEVNDRAIDNLRATGVLEFTSESDLDEAIEKGEITKGELVILNNKAIVL